MNSAFPDVWSLLFFVSEQVHELLTTDGLNARAAADAASSHPDAIELLPTTLHHPTLCLTSAYPSMAELLRWNAVR
jgi:hypothetical protein